eukprot:CAMPEP_0202897796 /NCGR_PEP_ID=MMETSP1392-20130828/6477_1 /ASSEMBLY_ACC=CAM_ASM_000868 /TAXON_ID=225041 /ORGANISM="Chlamydomonas chlamydogama, Strain SAG 11-48b" /LENGTH=148 /DNA_ID=CAMNT_0049583541 /DNA_START=8 /DNA_END=456 /DNA_ORIENTATION=-
MAVRRSQSGAMSRGNSHSNLSELEGPTAPAASHRSFSRGSSQHLLDGLEPAPGTRQQQQQQMALVGSEVGASGQVRLLAGSQEGAAGGRYVEDDGGDDDVVRSSSYEFNLMNVEQLEISVSCGKNRGDGMGGAAGLSLLYTELGGVKP